VVVMETLKIDLFKIERDIKNGFITTEQASI
jgi:hypothetical protein